MCSVRCWAVAAGAIMFVSELLLAGSLLTFQGPRVMKVRQPRLHCPHTTLTVRQAVDEQRVFLFPFPNMSAPRVLPGRYRFTKPAA